jgi:predicted RNase H-like HicB family nuclease
MKKSFTVVFDKDADGYTVTVPSLPGLITAGKTLEEARDMALDAIRCHIESLLKDGEPIPEEGEVGLEKLEVELSVA